MLKNHGWIEIITQENMNNLFQVLFSMHDGMLKEFHVINRGFVNDEFAMAMSHSFDGLFILQSQWKPGSITILLMDIQNINIKSANEYWGGSGVVEENRDGISFSIKADDGLLLKAKKMFYKITPENLGISSKLGSEIPALEMFKSFVFDKNWRQCDNCKNIWEVQQNEIVALCPECSSITILSPSQNDNDV